MQVLYKGDPCHVFDETNLEYHIYDTNIHKHIWVRKDECDTPNPILDSVKSLLEQQTQKGIQKYGHTVKPDDYSVIGWVEHAQQEIIDQLVYLEVLKQKLKG